MHAATTNLTPPKHEDDDPPRPGVNPGPFPGEMAVRRARMARPHMGLTSGANVNALETTIAHQRASGFVPGKESAHGHKGSI